MESLFDFQHSGMAADDALDDAASPEARSPRSAFLHDDSEDFLRAHQHLGELSIARSAAAAAAAHNHRNDLPMPDEDTIEILCDLLSVDRGEAIEILQQHNNLLANVLEALY